MWILVVDPARRAVGTGSV